MAFQRISLNNFFYLSAALGFTSLAATNRDWPVESKKYCAFAAVTGSVTFLECSINGLYAHADGRLGRKTNYRRLLASVFHEKLKFSMLPWLTKYQVALALGHHPTFDLGKEPYQSAELLNQLRNELIHPKEIFGGINKPFDKKQEKSALEKKLQGRFTFNPPRVPEENEIIGDEFLPDRCLSVGCAIWAVQTAAKFYNEFERKMPDSVLYFMERGHAKSILAELKKLKEQEKEISIPMAAGR
jgi:hypothetical protein